MLPAHCFPTHSKTCLDHLILKTKLQASCYVAETSLTDHDTILFTLEINQKGKILSHHSKKQINYDDLDGDIERLDMSIIYSMDDVDEAVSFLLDSLNKTIENNTRTIKTTNRKLIKKPWITPGVLRCLRNRDKLHQKCKKYPHDDVIRITYKRYRNYCKDLIIKLKCDYEKTILTAAAKTSSKKLWDTIKMVTNTYKQKDSADVLVNKSDPISSVDQVNSYFVGIGKTLAEKHCDHNNASAAHNTKHNPSSMVLIDASCDEIELIIINLKSDCAVGRDNISATFLKRYRKQLVPPITFVCNLAIKTGRFPKRFKLAEIRPIFKSGDRESYSNYRPISILPTISKILERVLNKRLNNFLEENKLLSSSQYGFRSKRSTHDAVHELTNFIALNLDNKKKVVVICLDLAKAFDTVSVPLLLKRLEQIGVRGVQLELFADYLSNRYQRVKIGNYCSHDLPVTYGVPQGSVLGPTLFLTYVNSLCELEIANGKIIAFADDTALLFQGDSWSDVFESAQRGFNAVTKWLTHNKLTLNTDKTKYLAFASRKTTLPESDTLSIVAHHCPRDVDNVNCSCPTLSRTNTIKYLGVMIDDTLSFNPHITLLTTRIRKLMYIFRNLRRVANTDVIKMVYYALCQSLLTYCITSWGGAPKSSMLHLERAQRAILKISCGSYRVFCALW
ncbi:probable RNA-directed DNA polymerase from transposon BS isoform X1 [Ostrinia nubilalis]|uniref:probable RNA-directed DNA polymerase from transposon BS isoform X1 n=1 Tax=Ostrinia nubilalis TaxID=29057 RepID=UPI0030823187